MKRNVMLSQFESWICFRRTAGKKAILYFYLISCVKKFTDLDGFLQRRVAPRNTLALLDIRHSIKEVLHAHADQRPPYCRKAP